MDAAEKALNASTPFFERAFGRSYCSPRYVLLCEIGLRHPTSIRESEVLLAAMTHAQSRGRATEKLWGKS
jgi:hypothetical protein